MIIFIGGFVIGSIITTLVFVLIGKKRYQNAASILDKRVKDIIINNQD